MRQAFLMLGVLTTLMIVGLYLAFYEKAEAPTVDTPSVQESMSLTLSSPAFEPDGLIPEKYTCDGENTNPELRIDGVPEGTESFVLVMDDPDIPEEVKTRLGISKFDHWSVYNLHPDTRVVQEGGYDFDMGLTSRGEAKYTGPCPPDREHRYIFRLYALSGTLNFIKVPTLDEVEVAAQGMVLESATLIGRYNRNGNTQ